MTRPPLFPLSYLCLAVLGTLPLPGHAQPAEPAEHAKAAETVPAPLASTAADEIERTRPGSQPLKYELPPIDPRQVEPPTPLVPRQSVSVPDRCDRSLQLPPAGSGGCWGRSRDDHP